MGSQNGHTGVFYVLTRILGSLPHPMWDPILTLRIRADVDKLVEVRMRSPSLPSASMSLHIIQNQTESQRIMTHVLQRQETVASLGESLQSIDARLSSLEDS